MCPVSTLANDRLLNALQKISLKERHRQVSAYDFVIGYVILMFTVTFSVFMCMPLKHGMRLVSSPNCSKS